MLLAGVLLFVGAICIGTGVFQPYLTWDRCGPIQIVAGPDEAWCFLQVDHVVLRPGSLASPPSITMGHFQEVVVLSKSGSEKRIRGSIPDGVSFHPNSYYIFRRNDDFFLYESFSMNTHRSVYKWRDDHFDLLPLDESESILRSEDLHTIDPIEVDQLPRHSGWERISHDRGWLWFSLDPAKFRWQGRTFEIHHIEEKNVAKVRIRCLGESPWQEDLLQYDSTRRELSRKQYQALRDRPQQRGHPRVQ